MVTLPQTVDVVVVGAGIGGLAAARALCRHGRRVAVLEARDRVGGRLLSTESDLDLGATWFWDNEPRVSALAVDLGLTVHRQHIDGDALFHAPGGAQRIDGNPIDVPSNRIVGGMWRLAEGLALALPKDALWPGHQVTAVTADDRRLVVETMGGQVHADHVVVALPPALAIATVAFRPTLPHDLMALASRTPVWMGAVTKVVLRYPRPFWRDAGLAGSAVSHVGPLREIHDMSGPQGMPAALFGFAPATRAGDPAPTVDAVIGQLVQMFGARAGDASEVVILDWRAEQFTSPPGVESLTAYERFGDRRFHEAAMQGRLHWSSTETAGAFAGHVEGALEAAERTVGAILAST